MEEIEEIWKECAVTETRTYYVSNLGRVKTIRKIGKKELILKYAMLNGRYRAVKVIRKTIPVHTLVACAFLGPRPEGLEIDHIDRNKLNNRANNLRYVTHEDNQKNRDDYRHDILETDKKKRELILAREYDAKSMAIKIVCPCGITHSKRKQARHNKTQTHQNYLANLQNNSL